MSTARPRDSQADDTLNLVADLPLIFMSIGVAVLMLGIFALAQQWHQRLAVKEEDSTSSGFFLSTISSSLNAFGKKLDIKSYSFCSTSNKSRLLFFLYMSIDSALCLIIFLKSFLISPSSVSFLFDPDRLAISRSLIDDNISL